MYKLFLCLRYLLHRRIVIVPIIAVMLCVAMNLIVVSLMGGFLDKVKSSVRGLFGDIIVGNGSLTGFGYYDAYKDADGKEHPGLLQYLAKVSEVKQATPVIETYAILRLPDNRGFTNPVRVLGIVPDQYATVTDFADGLYWQRVFPPGVKDKAQYVSATEAPETTWVGRPSFDHVPNPEPGQPPLPLTARVPGVDEPAGVIVGVRVFWPSPDITGRYKRNDLLPGMEKVQLTLWPMSAKGTMDERPDMKQFYLVDTSYSHIPQIDQQIAYVSFDKLQQYLRMNTSEKPVSGFLAPARATRVLVKLNDGVDLRAGNRAVAAAVKKWTDERTAIFNAMPPEVRARAYYFEPLILDSDTHQIRSNIDVSIWEEANREYFAAIANQRFIALLMVGVVSLTVVALIWVIFIMIVLEKTKDIGIIKSIGGSASGVSLIFIAWAAVIGAIGSAFGGVLGWLFIRNINGIEQWLSAVISKITGEETKLFDPRAYLFDSIPARFVWSEFLWIAGFAILAAMLGALLPAWRAGRMNPVESLRYE
ncbi:MAG: FtsX-like permease family protein [Phycisphaerae bacterium]|nr:FtsX-like permease family protein [Phycisphaerae bacterium]